MSDCKHCGATFLKRQYPTIRSQMKRYCPSCLEAEDWNLDEGQDPVGYKIDKDQLKTNKPESAAGLRGDTE